MVVPFQVLRGNAVAPPSARTLLETTGPVSELTVGSLPRQIPTQPAGGKEGPQTRHGRAFSRAPPAFLRGARKPDRLPWSAAGGPAQLGLVRQGPPGLAMGQHSERVASAC